jgi:type II secretory ATPase GspE/PulE/Tfp pilus assembly ATPase PilB-like protein
MLSQRSVGTSLVSFPPSPDTPGWSGGALSFPERLEVIVVDHAAFLGTIAPSLSSLTLAEGFFLVSPWKPVLFLFPLVLWGVVVSKILDKHAARFNLPREQWGIGHMCAGLIALLVAFLIPLKSDFTWLISLAAMSAILVIDVLVYMQVSSKDIRVPAGNRVKLLDFDQYKAGKAAKAAAKKQGTVELMLRAADKSALNPPAADAPEFEVRVAAEQLYIKGIEARASQIDLGPTGKEGVYGVSYTIDGIRAAGDTMPAAEAIKLIDLWKSAAKLDLAERRKKLQADMTVERGDSGKRSLRVSSMGVQGGHVRLTIAIDPAAQVRRKVENLGFVEPPQLAEVKKLVEEGKGIILLAAPPDMGRTTTFYTIIKMHDAYTSNVQTLEIDAQDSLEGIRQNPWSPAQDGPEFSTYCRTLLRRDPNVLGVAELPDAATAKETVKADLERVRIYLSVRADSALQAVQGFVKLVGDPAQAGTALHGVVAQKLVRKLCETCRAAYQPAPDMVKKLGLPPDKIKQLFKKSGQVMVKDKAQPCGVCGGTGYLGQTACFEVFALNTEERELIKAQDWTGLKTALRKQNQPTIQQVAVRKAVDGITSVEEIIRVTSDAGEGTPKPAPTPASPAPVAAAPKKA